MTDKENTDLLIRWTQISLRLQATAVVQFYHEIRANGYAHNNKYASLVRDDERNENYLPTFHK